MTTSQGGYTLRNHFAAFAKATNEEVSDDDTAETITTTINSHMENLSAQTAASLDTNMTQINASLQQLAINNAQLHQQQHLMMQQMAMLMTNANTPRNNTYMAPPTQIYAPLPIPGYQQQSFYHPCGDYHGGGCSHGGRARHTHGGSGHGTPMLPIVPLATNVIPYIPAGVNPPQQNQGFYNIVIFLQTKTCVTRADLTLKNGT
jgi:hypothetical protein